MDEQFDEEWVKEHFDRLLAPGQEHLSQLEASVNEPSSSSKDKGQKKYWGRIQQLAFELDDDCQEMFLDFCSEKTYDIFSFINRCRKLFELILRSNASEYPQALRDKLAHYKNNAAERSKKTWDSLLRRKRVKLALHTIASEKPQKSSLIKIFNPDDE